MNTLPPSLPPSHPSCPSLQERVAYWHQHLGFSMPELRQLLDRLPHLLLYPVHEHKYQLKLRFLTGGLWSSGSGRGSSTLRCRPASPVPALPAC